MVRAQDYKTGLNVRYMRLLDAFQGGIIIPGERVKTEIKT